MVLRNKTKIIDNLIMEALAGETGLGFDELLAKIHNIQDRALFPSGRKRFNAHLSRKTLSEHLTKLVEREKILRKEGKTAKREVYALYDWQEERASFSNILVDLAAVKDTLAYYDQHPFFNFFMPFEKEMPTQRTTLRYLSQAMHSISERLDYYLKTIEVRA